MECPNCKKNITDRAKTCSACGSLSNQPFTHKRQEGKGHPLLISIMLLGLLFIASIGIYRITHHPHEFQNKNLTNVSTAAPGALEEHANKPKNSETSETDLNNFIDILIDTNLSELCNQLALHNYNVPGLLESLVVKGKVEGRVVSSEEAKMFQQLIALYEGKLNAESALIKSNKGFVILDKTGQNPDTILNLLRYFNYGKTHEQRIKLLEKYNAALLSHDTENANKIKTEMDAKSEIFEKEWIEYKSNIDKIQIYIKLANELQNNKTFAYSVKPNIVVLPSSSSITIGETIKFTAQLWRFNPSQNRIKWNASGGTISDDGLYTPPGKTGKYTITATATEDPSKSGSADVQVIEDAVFGLGSYSPSKITINDQEYFAVGVASPLGVAWSATSGHIEPIVEDEHFKATRLADFEKKNARFALFTAPNEEGTITITATSVADPSKSRTFTVKVISPKSTNNRGRRR